jgi:hypothetical protein
MILERTRHNFGGRSRAAVDQHDDRLVFGQVARARIEPLGFLGGAAARRYVFAASFEDTSMLHLPGER